MDINGLFKKYHTRLVWEGILKAVMYGFSAGALADTVISLVSWLVGFKNGLWIAIGAWVGITALVSVLLYFLCFRPDTKMIAERIDALGLEERMITMNELQSCTSYLAMRQREDAVAKLGLVAARNLKLLIPQLAIIATCASGALSAGFTTAMALYSADVIGDLPEIVDPLLPPKDYEVNYEVIDEQTGEIGIGGSIVCGNPDIHMGDMDQCEVPNPIVQEGQDAEAVLAVEDEGWMFLGWYYENGELAPDGENPYRHDLNIREDLTFYAHFARVAEDESDDDGSGEGDGDEADDRPQEGDSSGDQEEDDQPGSSAGGQYDENNFIKDGNTHYKENWDEYYQQMLERLAEDGELTDEMRQIIEDYFNIIK